MTSIGRYRTGDLEVSYQLFPENWGSGYGREAVFAAIAWGFENYPDRRLIAITQSSNLASRKLLEYLGMKVADEFEEFSETQTMYEILRTDEIA